MKSKQINNTIYTAQTFKTRPSQLLAIEDEYVAYCFDEACAYILGQLKDGKTPHYDEDRKANKGLQTLIAGE